MNKCQVDTKSFRGIYQWSISRFVCRICGGLYFQPYAILWPDPSVILNVTFTVMDPDLFRFSRVKYCAKTFWQIYLFSFVSQSDEPYNVKFAWFWDHLNTANGWNAKKGQRKQFGLYLSSYFHKCWWFLAVYL